MAPAKGSSPRMRGAQSRHVIPDDDRGIIPAYAGSTNEMDLTLCRPEDHPRVCGEHAARNKLEEWKQGSSPRMRGARTIAIPGVWIEGIIPAYAGSTNTGTCTDTWSTDHPRVCGEHINSNIGMSYPRGSSPRMRGARTVPGRKSS